MLLGKYAGFFFVSMVKFLFAPFAGPAVGLSFWETYFSCTLGAFLSALLFYFSAEYFLNRARKKRHALFLQAKENGTELKAKKKFTRSNKLIVKMKHSIGIYGIGIFAPLFLSIPLGSLISAKFYGKDKRTFLIICFGIFLNGFITTGLAYIKMLF